MSQARDLLKGLRSTQASEVHVPFEVVCSIVGREVAEKLALNITGFSQTPYKPNMPSKEAIEKVEMRKPHNLGTFDREDLLSVIDEMIDEAGSLDNLLQEVEDHRTPLQKIREELEDTIPFPQPDPEDTE